MKTVAQLAEAIWAARQAGRTLDADATVGSPDLATAYAIQRALLGLRLAAGERVVGWKLGYTSEVMRRQMGIARPNIGPLTDRMLLNSGDAVHERLVQPRVACTSTRSTNGSIKDASAAVAVISECNFSWPSLTEFGAPFGVAALETSGRFVVKCCHSTVSVESCLELNVNQGAGLQNAFTGHDGLVR
ncbi:hypothetical protein N5K27_24155 [Pigmentiphaga sp. GD03639]|uniref:hypothetical protein n=1 Tax=Pigmentiphaga sp. GD03639 TaxID=2975354 RepID=UPI00244B42A0|nr:hypothetical protein [Pigmentiphaga sp. GD03639]MDH2239410.1 hypothetical protein [Pigmentiphaga sp. GD03639]